MMRIPSLSLLTDRVKFRLAQRQKRACTLHSNAELQTRLNPARSFQILYLSTRPPRASEICWACLGQLFRAMSRFRGERDHKQGRDGICIHNPTIYQTHDEERKVSAAHAASPNGPATAYTLPCLADPLGASLDSTGQDPERRRTIAIPPRTTTTELQHYLT